jgi:ABC-2 type transport system permease protein
MGAGLRRIYRQLRASIAFAWLNGIVAARRNPLWVISYIIAPLSFLVLIRVFAKESMIGYGLVGGLLMTIVSNGIGLMGDTVFYKNTIKLQDMMVASPLNPLSYLTGFVLSGLFFAIPGLTIFWILMIYYGLLTLGNALVLTIISLLTLVPMAGIGFITAGLVKEERFVWPLSGILTFLLTVLPPVYYPSTLLPEKLAVAALLLPTCAGAALFHKYTGLLANLPVKEAVLWSILLIEGVVLILMTLYQSRWREK